MDHIYTLATLAAWLIPSPADAHAIPHVHTTTSPSRTWLGHEDTSQAMTDPLSRLSQPSPPQTRGEAIHSRATN